MPVPCESFVNSTLALGVIERALVTVDPNGDGHFDHTRKGRNEIRARGPLESDGKGGHNTYTNNLGTSDIEN